MTKQLTAQVKGLDGRRIEFIASHEKVDRDGEVVLVVGIDTAAFMNNPLMFVQHDTQQIAAARVTSLRKTTLDGALALIGVAEFPDRPQSDAALADVRAGLLNAVSIGFQVMECGAPILPGQAGVTYTRTKLLEISLVGLPACPTCLITSKSAGGCRCQAEGNALDGLLILDEEVLFDHEIVSLTCAAVRSSVREVVNREVALAVRRERDYQRGRIIDY